ncbi:MAG: D-aminoacylase [Candidatus Aminicenantes bacterium]|nr:D-aminoacylase [Candidatus Aminicenantes bacterium]
MGQTINRREFLKHSGSVAAVAALSGGGVLLQGCTAGKDYDLVVAGGLVYDGLGGAPVRSDIGISGSRIKAVGKIPGRRGRAVVEAAGKAVSPGFIDVHDHSDIGLLANPRAESAVRQGVTTLMSGNCGSSPFPVADDVLEELKSVARTEFDVDMDWRDLGGFFARLEKSGTAVNYATLVGHGAVRGAAMGFNDRPPKPDELNRMKAIVAENMDAGAFGLSTGLEYTPGSFAAPVEIAELCKIVAGRGGVYATHMRDEGDRLIEAIEEAIEAARKSGVKLQISHLKTAFPRNWGKVGEVLALLDRANKEGLAVRADRYPYIAGSTGLSINFPTWARQGTTEEFLARLKDPALDDRLREYVAEREKKFGSWDKVVVSGVSTANNKWVEGLDVLAASQKSGKPPYEFMRDLIVEEKDLVDSVLFMMTEDNLRRILAHPQVGIGSDSSVRAPYGILSTGKPHPRVYGTFPRVLGKYVREEKLLSAEAMIRKMTSVPASSFGLADRGVIKEGAFADLVVFDPAAVADRATWKDPHQYPAGIEAVIVNGAITVGDGEHTGTLAGSVLRKTVIRR